jgi:hypothetical protein
MVIAAEPTAGAVAIPDVIALAVMMSGRVCVGDHQAEQAVGELFDLRDHCFQASL